MKFLIIFSCSLENLLNLQTISLMFGCVIATKIEALLQNSQCFSTVIPFFKRKYMLE